MTVGTTLPEVRATKQRVTWIDAAKGLAIVLVVVLHATEALRSTGLAERSGQLGAWDSINYALGSMRMPLFFAMSGLLALKWTGAPWRALLSSKVALFVWLLALWPFVRGAGYLVGAVVTGQPHPWDSALETVELPGGVSGTIDGPVAQVVSTLLLAPFWPYGIRWFLWALAAFFVLARVLHRVPPWVQLTATAAVSLLGFLNVIELPNKGWNGALDHVFFFFAGLYLRQYFLRAAERVTVLPGAAVFGVWAAACVWFWLTPNTALLVLLPVTGIAAGVVIGRAVSGVRLLRFVGARTLTVYLTHMLVIHAFVLAAGPLLDRLPPGLFSVCVPVVAAVGVAGSLAIGSIAARTPVYWLYALPHGLSRVLSGDAAAGDRGRERRRLRR